jgi:hypothetical protein
MKERVDGRSPASTSENPADCGIKVADAAKKTEKAKNEQAIRISIHTTTAP